MSLRKKAARNPASTFSIIITTVSSIWYLAVDNAELFGIGGKTIAIGALVLTAATLIYDNIKGSSTE